MEQVEKDQKGGDVDTASSPSSSVKGVWESLTESVSQLLVEVPDEPSVSVVDSFENNVKVVTTPKGEAHFSCPRTLPHPKWWPHKPLLLRESSVHSGWNALSVEQPVPLNGSIYHFETPLFKGRILVRMRGLESAQKYFEGKNRLSSIVISGQFKQELAYTDVQTGQEFCKPVKQPSAFLVKALVKFFRLLAPLLQLHIGEQSYFLSPLAQTSQVIHVADDEPKLSGDMEVEENWGQVIINKQMTNLQRKKFFSSRKNLEKFKFDTTRFYTFDFYNDKLDMETFKLKAMGQEFNVQKYLQGQPLRILTRVFKAGEPSTMYLWNFEMWHEGVTDYLQEL